jgi:putative copper export protein
MADTFLLIVRWAHIVAAAAWVGGGIFFWVVLRPTIRSGQLPQDAVRFAGVEFGKLVVLAMWTLALTGAILMLDRLSSPAATLPYGIVLGVKIALSAWMFFLTLGRRGREPRPPGRGRLRSAVDALGHINMTVVLGIIVFLLSDILRFLVEAQLID